ncbi:AAA family ATPase [Tardiphaga sp. 172_B4_N1_3]|uniref:AAA family ATPase n=1 Tax=Tardiphaga sp. 172_B4_N1_3 TaxID=3240787 RepID=UPI003F8CD115
MNIQVSNRSLKNLTKINVVMGKNGSGKSTLLRILDQQKAQLPQIGTCRYITPERGGQLTYDGSIETADSQNPGWKDDVRRNNRYESFRQMSVSEYRRLETLVLRKIATDKATRQDLGFSFDTTLNAINNLLDNVRIEPGHGVGFEIKDKIGGAKRPANSLSSGEAELISLAIEILAFAYETEGYKDRDSYLLLDEPDVHLHPDLQERLMTLLKNAVADRQITVIIATHSTAILGALSDEDSTSVGFILPRQNAIEFMPIVSSIRDILPIFGAHPLSNVFNSNPILLVEGEDDERIWQQAARTSQGRIRVWPCHAGDIQSLDDYENKVELIAGAVYDKARAYSLRDRDENPYEIDDKPIVKRMRLFCRAAENLILSDDVLKRMGTDWETIRASIGDWLEKFPDHQQFPAMKDFRDSGYDRRTSDIKELRNIIMMLAGSNKAWEVVVGQSIAGLLTGPTTSGDHSLPAYLGQKLIEALKLTRPKCWEASASKRAP